MFITVRLTIGLVLTAHLALAFSKSSGLRPRQYSKEIQADIEHQAKDDPLGATERVKDMPNLGTPGYESFAKHKNGVYWLGDASSHHQVAWFDGGDFPFIQPDGAQRDDTGGLTSVPTETNGFVLKDDLKLKGNAVQPYYITKDYNPKDVKRAVIVFPGMPRDAWKWATLMLNDFRYVYSKNKYCYQKKDAIILSPLTLNLQDSAAVQNANWALYKNSNWEAGGVTQFPKMEHGVSYFTMIDKMIDKLLDKSEFPNLEKVVLAGHSMGGQAVQHYAMMRKNNKKQESSLLYWIGNPGAWTWPNAGRPTYWPNCQDQMNIWPYGLNETSSHISYNKAADPDDLLRNFFKRDVQIALGLNDNGAGQTQCQAWYQGANHLDRGANFVQSVAGMPGGFPSNFEVNYVAFVAHQDYPMFSANRSLDFIWGKDFNGDCSAAPPTVASSSSSTSTSTSTSSKSTSSSTSTSSSSSTSSLSSTSSSTSFYPTSTSSSSSSSSSSTSQSSTSTTSSTSSKSSSASSPSSMSSIKPTTITTDMDGSTATVTVTASGGGQECGNGSLFGGAICISDSGNGNDINIG